MSFRIFVISFIFYFLIQIDSSISQNFKLTGKIIDAIDKKAINKATIFIDSYNNSITTDKYGIFNTTIKSRKFDFIVNKDGYQSYQKKFKINGDTTITIYLQPLEFELDEIIITNEKKEEIIKNLTPGKIKLTNKELKAIPTFLGESDPLKALVYSTGVQSSGEGNTGLFVRGSPNDQNLILLDNMTIYNPSHLFGFFSVFNSNAISSIELLKSGIPANYGGRTASVLNVNLKQADFNKFKLNGSLGLISAGLTLEFPIVKNKLSVLASYRRTYINELFHLLFNNNNNIRKGSGYYFYDSNIKISYSISNKNKLFINFFSSKDDFDFAGENYFTNSINWNNTASSIQWNHIFNKKTSSTYSLSYSNYNFNFHVNQSGYDLNLSTGVYDINSKFELIKLIKEENKLRFGVHISFNKFIPNNINLRNNETVFNLGDNINLYTYNTACFISYQKKMTDKLKFETGLRLSYYNHIGPYKRLILNEQEEITDSVLYKTGKSVKSFFLPEPRFSMRYMLDSLSSLKITATYTSQNYHLASISSISLPTDVWVPSSINIKPQKVMQLSLGYFKLINESYDFSTELYYKYLWNQLEYQEGLVMLYQQRNFDDKFFHGYGYSYGFETSIAKTIGNITGSFNYTLSRSMRVFKDINKGEPFPAHFDRLHDLSLLINYKISRKWNLSFVFIFSSGNAITLPIGRYLIQNNVINIYSKKNALRMPPYHRADISFTYQINNNKRFNSELNFSIYNVYNHLNPYYIYFDVIGVSGSDSFQVKSKQVSLFPIMPSLSWRFNF